MADDSETEKRRQQIAENMRKLLGDRAIVVVPEDPLALYARRHALHDRLVDTANRVIEIADLVGENRLWALSDTPTVLLEARYIVRIATERWAGFPMSNDLREALARLEREIEKLDT